MKNYNRDSPNKYLKLIKRKHYSRALHLMEPQVPMRMDDGMFFYYLGICCLMSGDIGGAYSYCNRARSNTPENPDVHLLRALIHLKKRERKEAIRVWLKILDMDPENKRAKYALNYVKKAANDEVLQKGLSTKTIKNMVYIPTSNRWIVYLVLSIAGMTLAMTSFNLWGAKIPNLIPKKTYDSSRATGIHLDYNFKTRDILELSGDYKYNYTEAEVQESYSRAVEYFNNFNDNRSQYEINRIKYSNAAEDLKSRAILLEGYLKEPDFTTLKTNYTYDQVINDLYLYENCYIKWRGKITNFNISESEITFDFLIGYEKEEVLQGILPVTFDFEILIDPDLPVELIAQIEISEYNPVLKGVSIRQIVINDKK